MTTFVEIDVASHSNRYSDQVTCTHPIEELAWVEDRLILLCHLLKIPKYLLASKKILKVSPYVGEPLFPSPPKAGMYRSIMSLRLGAYSFRHR